MSKDTQTNKNITKYINKILKKTIKQNFLRNFNKSKVFYEKNIIKVILLTVLTLTMQKQESNKSDCISLSSNY